MPECENCGAKVSQQFADVHSKRRDTVPACPNCDDARMQNGEKYEYKS